MELEVENQYIMSPKDLKTIHFMNKMMDAGVRVFKIEGRARGPEYVRTVCECYNEAILAHLDGSYTEEKIQNWDERLATVFNRGFWDGYYLGQRLGEWTHKYGSSATRVKTHVGRVIKYFSKLGVAELELESGLIKEGEELLITGPTTGAVFFPAQEMRVADSIAPEITEKGIRFSVKVPEKVRPGDRLYVMRMVEEKGKSKFL